MATEAANMTKVVAETNHPVPKMLLMMRELKAVRKTSETTMARRLPPLRLSIGTQKSISHANRMVLKHSM